MIDDPRYRITVDMFAILSGAVRVTIPSLYSSHANVRLKNLHPDCSYCESLLPQNAPIFCVTRSFCGYFGVMHTHNFPLCKLCLFADDEQNKTSYSSQ